GGAGRDLGPAAGEDRERGEGKRAEEQGALATHGQARKLPGRRLRSRRGLARRRQPVFQVGLEEVRLRRDEVAVVQERWGARKPEPQGEADVAEDPFPRPSARELGFELLLRAGCLCDIGGELAGGRRSRSLAGEERLLVLRVERRVHVRERGAVLRGR